MKPMDLFTSMLVVVVLTLPALGAEPRKPAHVKVAAVQMPGYDKTDVPRPGSDPSEAVVGYVERAAMDGAQLVVFPEYLLGRISVPGPETERISKAAAAGRIYVIVGCWEVFKDGSFANTALLFDRRARSSASTIKSMPPWTISRASRPGRTHRRARTLNGSSETIQSGR